MKLYTGSCYCGGVCIAVISKPLPETEVREDNCSICRRVRLPPPFYSINPILITQIHPTQNGNASLYPTQSYVHITGAENTTMYRFAKGWVGHPFCKTCGVQVYMKVFGPEVKESWSDEMRTMVAAKCRIVPVRVAVLEGVERGSLKVERSDEGTEGYVID